MAANEEFLRANYNQLCRFCLKHTKTTQNFAKLIDDPLECENLRLLGIEVRKNTPFHMSVSLLPCSFKMSTIDGLPNVVCTNCYDFIHELNEFHRICRESHRTLADLHTVNLEIQQEFDNEEADCESYELLEVVDTMDHEAAPSTNKHEDTTDRINGRLYRQCSVCGKIIKNLKEHLLTHTQVKKYQCHHCNKLFGDKSNMAKHMRIHFNIRNYVCQICARTFIIASSLRKHLTTHKDKVPCNLCSRTFKNDKYLAIHYRTHTQDTAYECVACDRSFATESALISHNRIHDQNWKEPKRKRRPKQIVVIGVSRE
jgi:DNA-directed RNA polymerase subunit RPC12/RpoP